MATKSKHEQKTLPKPFINDELEHFFDDIRHSTRTGLRDRAMFELMLGAGLRTSEVTHLRRADIDWTAGTVEVVQGKGAKDRVVPLPARTIDWLRQWDAQRDSRAATFFHSTKGTVKNAKGKRLSPRSLQCQFARHRDSAGLRRELTPHSLRHTLATQRLGQGFTIRQVQELLGHENVSTTEIYTHVSQDALVEQTRKLDQQQALDRAPSAKAIARGQALEALTDEQFDRLLEILGAVSSSG